MSVTDRHGNNNSFSRQQTFLDDGTGPNVTDTGPRNATVGEPVAFSAAETTDGQGVESIQWQVGDDTILSGENITVAFASPGSHEVAVTATDPFGNTETVTRVVSVTGNGTVGNVTVQQPNATVASVSVNGTGQSQVIQPQVGALTSGPKQTPRTTHGVVPVQRICDAHHPLSPASAVVRDCELAAGVSRLASMSTTLDRLGHEENCCHLRGRRGVGPSPSRGPATEDAVTD